MAKLKSLAIMLLAGYLLSACQPELQETGEPTTGLAFTQASAQLHDPEGHWPVFAQHFKTEHFSADGNFGYRESLFVDVRLDSFYRLIEEGGYSLEQFASLRSCSARWPKPAPTLAEQERVGLTENACAVIRPRQRYHTFLLGLPMSALTEEARFGESLSRVTVWGEALIAVNVEFPNDPVASQWQLLFEAVTKQFRGAHFRFNAGGGEWMEYRETSQVGGLMLGSVRRIYYDDATTVLVEQRLTFTGR